MSIKAPKEPRILGVYGRSELARGIGYLHHGIKSTQAYTFDPSDETFNDLLRNTELIAPHASRARFETRLGRNPSIFLIPHGEQGPRWHEMRRATLRRTAGQTAVGRRIFFPPLSHENPSLNPPANTLELAFLELLHEPNSLNHRLPPTEMRQGGTMVVLGLGESALDEISIGEGKDVTQIVFDPTPLNNRTSPQPEALIEESRLLEKLNALETVARYLIITAQ